MKKKKECGEIDYHTSWTTETSQERGLDKVDPIVQTTLFSPPCFFWPIGTMGEGRSRLNGYMKANKSICMQTGAYATPNNTLTHYTYYNNTTRKTYNSKH